MKWLRDHLLLLTLHLVALAVMAYLLCYCFLSQYRFQNLSYSLTLVVSGKWAIRFLLTSLLMTPLYQLFGWRTAIKLRRPAGLWAFTFAAFHFSIYLSKMKLFWFQQAITGVEQAFGFISFCVMLALALTSLRDSMRQLGKWWKPLHRLVYLAGVTAVVHMILESSNSRVTVYDPDVMIEAVIYSVVLAMLLMVRLPQVRWMIQNKKRRKPNPQTQAPT